MRKCTTCKIEKAYSDFHKSSDRANGYSYKCKACQIAYNKDRYQKNKNTLKLKDIERRYLLSKEQYAELLSKGCSVCLSKENLHVDHDHNCCPGSFTCGKCVRGLLCRRCNIAEGWFKDDPDMAIRLANYIKRV